MGVPTYSGRMSSAEFTERNLFIMISDSYRINFRGSMPGSDLRGLIS